MNNNMVNKCKCIVQCNFQDLSEAQMQKVAAEMNLSETVFLRNKEKNGSFSKGITIAGEVPFFGYAIKHAHFVSFIVYEVIGF